MPMCVRLPTGGVTLRILSRGVLGCVLSSDINLSAMLNESLFESAVMPDYFKPFVLIFSQIYCSYAVDVVRDIRGRHCHGYQKSHSVDQPEDLCDQIPSSLRQNPLVEAPTVDAPYTLRASIADPGRVRIAALLRPALSRKRSPMFFQVPSLLHCL